jgi:hypothetical protein
MIPKYASSVEFCERMTQRNPHNRPDCEEILKHKNDWSVDDKDYGIRKQFEIMRENNNDFRKSFICSIISDKLHFIHEKEHVFGRVDVSFE